MYHPLNARPRRPRPAHPHGPDRDRLSLAKRVLLQRGSDTASLAWAAHTILDTPLDIRADPRLCRVARFTLTAITPQPEPRR